MSDLDQVSNKNGKLWVNVASSIHVLEKFTNLDNHLFIRFVGLFPLIRPIVPKKYHALFNAFIDAKKRAVLLKHDCRKPLPFPDDSVDHILCSHFLEHVFPDEMAEILRDFRRALKPGATAHIIVPDLEVSVRKYLDNKKNNEVNAADQFVDETLLSRERRGSLKYRFLEFVGGFGLQHYWVYDRASLVKRLELSGFHVVDENDSPSCQYRLNDGSLHVLAKKPI